jgi:DNA repair protein RadA/Sms
MWGTNFKDGKSGIVRGSVTLIGGSPGAGKSTLLIMMANAASLATAKESAYIATEEPEEQIKDRADRLDLGNQGMIRMFNGQEIGSLDPTKFGFLILDSVNGLAGEDQREAVTVAKILKKMVEKGKCPAIAISHINKRGDIAGLEALQHEVDTTMTFFPTEENLGEESPRQLVVEKNRNGSAYKKMTFAMTEKGLVVMEEEEKE